MFQCYVEKIGLGSLGTRLNKASATKIQPKSTIQICSRQKSIHSTQVHTLLIVVYQSQLSLYVWALVEASQTKVGVVRESIISQL